MQGFADQTATDLGRVLFEAVQSGENPRQTAKIIRERFGVSRSRAERIARTETTMALRRGRWDEAREQEQKLGMEVRLLHNSALIFGRTRATHARRHGKIVTIEEEAAWYAKDANAINCLCSQTEILVGKDGEPLFGQQLVERMQVERAKFLGEAVPAAPKPKGDPRADSLRRLKGQPVFSGAQDGSMNSAPLLSLLSAEKAGDLRAIVSGTGAYCDFDGRISMGRHVKGTEAYRRVFRHEYGHYIDDSIAKSGLGVEGATKMFASFRAVDDLAKDTAKLEATRSAPFMGERLTSRTKAKIQSSKDALRKRSNEILDDMIDFFETGTKEQWADKFFEPYGLKGKDVTAMFGGSPDTFSSVQLARLSAAWERKDVNELLYWIPRERGVVIDHSTPFAGLQDTFQTGTGGNYRIQFGHAKSYYTKGTKALRYDGLTKKIGLRTYNGYNTAQAFANWFEAYGDSNPVTAAMYRHLWPNVFEKFEGMLKEFVGAR
jgi:SPP1 gp7 family putative phage head morphogenesis protein